MNRRKIPSIIAAVAIAIAGTATVVVPAGASTDDLGEGEGTVTGGDVTAPEDRIELDHASAAKVAEALETAAGLPGVTLQELALIRDELEGIRHLNPVAVGGAELVVSEQYERLTSGVTNDLVVAPRVPTVRLLTVTYQGQSYDYYCGPATASMIVKFKGKNYSQSKLAGADYLNTNANKVTRWTDKRMHTTLNKVLGVSRYRAVQSPSLATLKGAFVSSVNARYPLAVSTVEFGGSSERYNGHPRGSKDIGHWIVGRGYDGNGSTLLFVDPAAILWDATNPTFSQSASSFHQFVKTNGIVY